MKKAIEYIGILCLFCFSLFYTDKAVSAVRNLDPIMVQIKEDAKNYDKSSMNAAINKDEIIPGVNGCVVNVNRSYERMKEVNIYNSKLLQYEEVKPSVSSIEAYDKYIVRGNVTDNKISIVMHVLDTTNIDLISDFIKEKQIQVNFFIDGTILEKNTSYLSRMKAGNEIYNAGYNGEYEKSKLLWVNNIINSLTANKSNYCLNLDKNSDALKLCSKNKMYTIKPSIVLNNSNYIMNINSIAKGSIIYFDSNNTESFTNTINFLIRKGYSFVLLSDLLNENRC